MSLSSSQGLLHKAAEVGDVATVRHLVEEKGANVNGTFGSMEWTLLHCAACYGVVEVGRYTMGAIFGVSGPSNRGQWMPLHWAARHGRVEVIKYLLEHGADANAVGTYQFTPLHCAATNGQAEAAKLLVGLGGARINIPDSSHSTPLHCAARQGWMEVVRYLVEQGAELGIKDNYGKRPIDSTSSHEVRGYLQQQMDAVGEGEGMSE